MYLEISLDTLGNAFGVISDGDGEADVVLLAESVEGLEDLQLNFLDLGKG